jgi:hypothetical protein
MKKEQKDKQWSTKQYTETNDRSTRTTLKTQVLLKIFRHTFFSRTLLPSIITVFWRFHYIDFPHFRLSPVKFTFYKNNKINKQKTKNTKKTNKWKKTNKQTNKQKTKKNPLEFYVTTMITCYFAYRCHLIVNSDFTLK